MLQNLRRKTTLFVIMATIITPMFLYWTFVYIFNINRFLFLLIIPIAVLLVIAWKTVHDNYSVIGFKRWFRCILFSIIAYLPIAIFTFPGLYLSHLAEKKIYYYEEQLYQKCQDITKTIKEKQYVNFHWWNPFSWIKKEIEIQTTEKASFVSKLIYGGVGTLLSWLFIILRIMEILLIFFSFMYIHAQVVIRKTNIRTRF